MAFNIIVVSQVIKQMGTIGYPFRITFLIIICLSLMACPREIEETRPQSSEEDIKDFGRGAVVHYEYCTDAGLYSYLNKIKSTPGNYAVYIYGDAVFSGYMDLSNGVKISLRGDGSL